MLTRRRFLLGAARGRGRRRRGRHRPRPALTSQRQAVPRGSRSALSPPACRPRQHAWTATLARDSDGNPIAPRFDRLLFFDVDGSPTPAHARVLEAALRTLERRYRWGPAGLLFTAGWGPGLLRARAAASPSPIPRAKGLSDFELPAIDDYDLCLHLACDDERRLAAIEAALLGTARRSRSRRAARHLERAALARDANRIRRRRTARRSIRTSAGSQPATRSPKSAPLFMGFKSSLRRNQASEDDVTIPTGPFAGGTTMQVSYMRLRPRQLVPAT